jgi:hypothetical protein
MRHLPAPHRRSISDDPRALLLAQLHSDAPMHESLALLPPVLLFALLHVHTHVGWDACFAAVRQLNNDHGRHMRELSTALSLLKSLRGTRILDPLAWHAAARRMMHAVAHPCQTLRRIPARRGLSVRITRSDSRAGALHKQARMKHVVQLDGLLIECVRYWLSAKTSAPLTWL